MKDKVLVLFDVPPPATLEREFTRELPTAGWETERDVLGALRTLRLPHDVLGVYDDTDLIRQKIAQYQPDVVLNLIERFNDQAALEQQVAAFLESSGVSFTGCGSAGLSRCKDKAASKQILRRNQIRVPEFFRLPVGKKIVRPKRLAFPLFVKPLTEEASYGIAQASFVETDRELQQRAAFIHAKFRQDVIVEEYIDGRELYVSVLGNGFLKAFPIRELVFQRVAADAPKFASYRAKWDEAYRRRWGIVNRFASGLDAVTVRRIERVCRKICRLLCVTGYARLDLRLTAQGEVVFLEANPNPILSRAEDFAVSAARAGLPYPRLIERILRLGKGRRDF